MIVKSDQEPAFLDLLRRDRAEAIHVIPEGRNRWYFPNLSITALVVGLITLIPDNPYADPIIPITSKAIVNRSSLNIFRVLH